MTKADQAIEYHKTFETGGLRLKTIRMGLKFEIKCPGSRLTGKAPKCTIILRREFGLSGNPPKLLVLFDDLLIKRGIATREQLPPVDVGGWIGSAQ